MVVVPRPVLQFGTAGIGSTGGTFCDGRDSLRRDLHITGSTKLHLDKSSETDEGFDRANF